MIGGGGGTGDLGHNMLLFSIYSPIYSSTSSF
jgi:hypothetical protein